MSGLAIATDESVDEFVTDIKIKTEEDVNDDLTREVFYFNATASEAGGYVEAGQVVDQLLVQQHERADSKMTLRNLMDAGDVGKPVTVSHCVKYRLDSNGKNVKLWECGICHKEFSHQYILMRHLPTHTDERKFVCAQCGKAFRQMSTLSQHRAIHSKLRPHVCDVCQKTFNRVSTLISHRKTHTGNKPHCCHLCNKAFHQKGNLRNHIFTHTNERPYKCDVCHEGFNQMSNLMCHKFKAHQRADKPKYQCPACGKLFERRIALRNHEQYEHGDQPPPPATTTTPRTGGATDPPTPSVKYTNGVMVSKINTSAMKHAAAVGVVPFALLKPTDGIPVLVRVFPSGDNELLVPATFDDLKKYTRLMPKSDADLEEQASTRANAGIAVRIPVVATVVQRMCDGRMEMDIVEPGPHDPNAIVDGRSPSDGDFFEEDDDDEEEDEEDDEEDEMDEEDYYDRDEASSADEKEFGRDAAHIYAAAASLVGMQARPHAIDVDEATVEIFSHDELDIDITNSVIDLEKDHNAFGIIVENGYSVVGDEGGAGGEPADSPF